MVAQIDREYVRCRPWKAWPRLCSYLLFEGRPLTTRGRWINPLVFSFLRVAQGLPQVRSIAAPIFIVGAGRSGSTILGKVLSMHRDVGFLNEPKAIWHSLVGKEDLVGSYTSGGASYRLQASDATDSMRVAARKIYGLYLLLGLSNRVVEKYPEMIFRVEFLKALFPDAKFLFLSRSGVDACASISCWSDRLGYSTEFETVDWWGRDRRKWRLLLEQIVPEHEDLAEVVSELAELDSHRAMAAVEWIVSMREGLRLTVHHADSVLHVPYEMLCQTPARMLRSIFEFAELRDDERCLEYARRVLKLRASRTELNLPKCLVEPFDSVQTELGHESRAAGHD